MIINENLVSHLVATQFPQWANLPIRPVASANNLLVKSGQLSAVIDFGMLCVGDPACDLVIAWTLLKDESREIFRAKLPLDNDTWTRAKGWALWKALIIVAGLCKTNSFESTQSWHIIDAVLADPAR